MLVSHHLHIHHPFHGRYVFICYSLKYSCCYFLISVSFNSYFRKNEEIDPTIKASYKLFSMTRSLKIIIGFLLKLIWPRVGNFTLNSAGAKDVYNLYQVYHDRQVSQCYFYIYTCTCTLYIAISLHSKV